MAEISAILQKSDSLLTSSDWQIIESFSSERRRTEQFAWRLLLRRSLRKMGYGDEVLSAEVTYNDIGAPYIVDCEVCIGVSHSQSHVAVIIGDRPCAVDIELCARNFDRVESRFVAFAENQMLSKYHHESFALPVAWSAKETLYKLAATKELDLLEDIVLLSIDCELCNIVGMVTKGRFAHQQLTLSYCFSDDHIVVWAEGI